MQLPHIDTTCPLTGAERSIVAAWANGALTDKEVAKALGKGTATVRTQRESIAARAGSPSFKSTSAHLLIYLIKIGWLRFLVLTALSIAPVLELTQNIDIQNERARRTRRELRISAKITRLHTGGAA